MYGIVVGYQFLKVWFNIYMFGNHYFESWDMCLIAYLA